MGQARSGRVALSVIVGFLSTALAASCGSTSPKNGGDDEPQAGDANGNGDAGAGAATGGGPDGLPGGRAGSGVGGNLSPGGRPMTAGTGGFPVTGGTSGSGGSFVVAGAPGTGGGTSACVEGVPCTCGKNVGVTACEDGEETCACPPAKDCAEAAAPEPCFEPCGGEPFGAWVVEETCLGGKSEAGDCLMSVSGASKAPDLRVRILDGGEVSTVGSALWDVSASASLECLNIQSVNACERTSLFSNALVFTPSALMPCEANACGVCDCAAEARDSLEFGAATWQRQGTKLTVNGVVSDYCVQGDEMWIGGTNGSGSPKVAYKLKKESCVGTPVPCAERSVEECGSGNECSLGRCVATSGTPAHCTNGFNESQCNVIQGCTWDPEVCQGEASPLCNFDTCDVQPGCSWGAPTERCGGWVTQCGDRPAETCGGFGCVVRTCFPNDSEFADCPRLSVTDCASAPGCTVSAGACTGNPRCTTQTDAAICNKLGCAVSEFCEGLATECHLMSVADCQLAPGCRIEW